MILTISSFCMLSIIVGFISYPFSINDVFGVTILNLSNTLPNSSNPNAEKNSIMTKIEPHDLSTDTDMSVSPSDMLAQKLHAFNPQQIANLHLEKLPIGDLMDAFTKLSIFDLDKTLQSLDQQSLREIIVKIISYYK